MLRDGEYGVCIMADSVKLKKDVGELGCGTEVRKVGEVGGGTEVGKVGEVGSGTEVRKVGEVGGGTEASGTEKSYLLGMDEPTALTAASSIILFCWSRLRIFELILEG
jgi:hypothetical protein